MLYSVFLEDFSSRPRRGGYVFLITLYIHAGGVDIPALRHRGEREREHAQYPSHPGSCKHSPTQPTVGYFCQDGHQQGRISQLWRILQRMPQWSHFSEDYRRNEKTRAEEFFNLTQFCAKFCDVKMENMVQVFLWAKWYESYVLWGAFVR